MQIVTGNEMKRIDEETIKRFVPGLTLMERAGQRVMERIESEFGSVEGLSVSIFLGRGNNAGDGLVVARLLKQRKATVRLDYMSEPKDFSPDTFKMYAKLSAFRKRRQISERFLFLADWEEKVRRELEECDLIIDALLGTGISKPVKESYARVITIMNQSSVPVLSIDIPSGVNADTAEVMGIAVEASMTVTLALPKVGLLFHPGRAHAGSLSVGDIGIPPEVIDQIGLPLHMLDADQARDDLPEGDPTDHKFARGSLLLVAGSRRYAGAARLAAESALRTGCGIVYLAGPESIRQSVQTAAPEIIFISLPETTGGSIAEGAEKLILDEVRHDALAVGPGLTTDEGTMRLVRALAEKRTVPLLLDADGINAFEGDFDSLVSLSKKTGIIASPHSGELARLTGRKVPDCPPAGRIAHLRGLVESTGIVLVHKGAPTVIAQPDGRLYVNVAGHPGQATAGSGDVLTGTIAGFLARGCPLDGAARAGVFLHSLAADIAAIEQGESGMIAGDCMRAVGRAMMELETM
jgi:NAD(P)H-hydrate epimerase